MGLLDPPALSRTQADVRYTPVKTTVGRQLGAPNGEVLLGTFGSDTDTNLYLLAGDGTTFDYLSTSPVYAPGQVVRDPSIIYLAGYYYCAYTIANQTSTKLGLARSRDLRTWTELGPIEMSGQIASVYTVWAPDLFVDTDGSIYMMFSASTGGVFTNFQLYAIKATDATLATWGAPQQVTGHGRADVIDAHVARDDAGVYHLFYKEHGGVTGGNQYLEHATASTYLGPYTRVGSGNWAGWGTDIEGPTVLRLANGGWRMYFDKYQNVAGTADPLGLMYSDGDSNFANWTARQPISSPGVRLRHCTAIVLTPAQVTSITSAAVVEQTHERRLLDTIYATPGLIADFDFRAPAGRSAALPAVNGALATVKDVSGNDNNLSQATASAQPAWTPPATGLAAAAIFNGNRYADSAAIAAGLPQPLTVYAVVRRDTNGSSNQVIGSTDATNSYQALNHLSAGSYELYAGASLTGGTHDAAAHVLCSVANGASSSIMKDGTVVASGNAGSNGVTAAAALRLGMRYDATRGWLGNMYRVLVFSGAHTKAQRAYISHLLGRVHGVNVPLPGA